MKKRLIKIVCFAAIFAALFLTFGRVLAHDWSAGDYLTERYEAFEEEEQIDILFAGASNVYAAVSPALVWNKAGMTSFNLGTSYTTTMQHYYQLKYAFTVHHPKLVVLDITGLQLFRDPTDQGEAAYQKVFATLPNHSIRLEMLKDMCARFEGVDPEMYLFPLLRYHDRWEELTESDFDHSVISQLYRPFRKGCYTSSEVEPFEPSDLIVNKTQPVQEMNMEFLEKIWELCRDNGAELMLLNSPNMRVNQDTLVQAQAFADERGLNYLYFESAEAIEALGIRVEEHFYNKNHLNIWGQMIFSDYITDYLCEHYTFESHEADSALCASWDETYREYQDYYDKVSKKDE